MPNDTLLQGHLQQRDIILGQMRDQLDLGIYRHEGKLLSPIYAQTALQTAITYSEQTGHKFDLVFISSDTYYINFTFIAPKPKDDEEMTFDDAPRNTRFERSKAKFMNFARNFKGEIK